MTEQAGGTAATNPWHDARLVLVTPGQAEAARAAGLDELADRFDASPPVWADTLLIDWLTARYMLAART